jgi:hypothetical protein
MLDRLDIEMAPMDACLLDPCVGPATFRSALVALGFSHLKVHSYDVDQEMVDATRAWATENNARIVHIRQCLETARGGCFQGKKNLISRR